jgi:hypothetical protein
MQRCIDDIMTHARKRHEEPSRECSCAKTGAQNGCC